MNIIFREYRKSAAAWFCLSLPPNNHHNPKGLLEIIASKSK